MSLVFDKEIDGRIIDYIKNIKNQNIIPDNSNITLEEFLLNNENIELDEKLKKEFQEYLDTI